MSAAILYAVFSVWPVIAFLGGLAFAPLAGLAAIVTSPVSVPRFRLRFYMVALLAFFAYAAASMLWSPRPPELVTGDLTTGSFAVRSEIPRVGLALVAGGLLIAVAQSLGDRQRETLQRVATVAFFIQLIAVLILTLFERQAIAFFYGARPDDEGVQNISRNSQILVLTAPFLILGLSRGKGLLAQSIIAAAVVAIIAGLVVARGVDMALLALALSGVFMIVVTIFKKNGWRLIGVLIATSILTAPFTGQVLSHGANAITATNSIEYRQAIWQRVLEVIDNNPVFGSGVGVLRTQREMIPEGVFANLYYIPNHAHNMLLQLWAETGVVGALLLAITVVLAAFRLPAPQSLGRSALRVAGLIGGMVAAWISFDLWNEWWWTVGILLAVLVAGCPSPSVETQRRTRTARGITFGGEQASSMSND